MISGTVRFGDGGVYRNKGDVTGGTGFLEYRGRAFNKIIDTNTAKLNALMEAMNGGGAVNPPDGGDGGGDGAGTLGDGDGSGTEPVQGSDQQIMAMWSQVNGQLNLAISMQGKDTQSVYESCQGLIQHMP